MRLNKTFLFDYLKLTISVIFMVYFFFYAGTKFNLIDLQALEKTGFVIFGIWLALLLFGKTRRTAVDMPILVFIAVMIFTSITGDLPRQAFVEVAYILIAILLFYFVVGVIHRGWDVRILSKSILIIGGVFMILAWLEFIMWYLAWLNLGTGQLIPLVSYRLPAPNFICAILNVWVLFAAAHFLYIRDKLPRILLGAYILSALGIIFLTSSRGGWLGLAGGTFLLLIAYIYKQQLVWLQKTIKLMKKPIYLVTALLILAFVMIAAFFLLKEIGSQPTHGSIFSSRGFLWNPAIQAIKDSPLIGHGPYAYIFYYLRGNSVPPNQVYDYAHNIYLDTLVSSGILGLGVLIWLIIVLYKSMKRLLDQPDSYLFYLGLGVFGSLSAFLIHGLFDSVHHTVPVSLWNLCVLLAVPIGYLSKNNPKKNYLPIGLGLLLIPSITWYIFSGTSYEKGLIFAAEENYSEAIVQMIIAEDQDPTLPLIPQQMGILYAKLAAQSGEEKYLLDARDAFEKTLLVDDSWAPNYLNLGVIYSQLGDDDLAEQNLLHAVRLSPSNSLYHWNLGEFYEKINSVDKAAQEYELCLAIDNRIILSSVWDTTEFRRGFSKQWRAEHQSMVEQFEQALSNTTGLLLATLYPSDAENPDVTLHFLVLASTAIEENRLDDAQKYLDEGQLAYTKFSESALQTHWLQAEIDAANHDFVHASESGEIALQAVINPGLFGPGSYGQQIYGPVVYRRHALPDYFIPQISQLPINQEWIQRLDKIIYWYDQMGNTEKKQYWELTRDMLIQPANQ